MSGQWEVVGKSKMKQNGQAGKKLTKSERKKFVEKAPKVEDILPLSQVRTLYTALEPTKEKKAPGKENSTREGDSKKVQKKQPEKKRESVKEKVPVPKSLESAVKLLVCQEMKQELEIGKARFEDAPLVWLKGLPTYLNTKLSVEHNNPTFAGKPLEYPFSLLPGEIKDLLKRAMKDAGETTIQPFYEWCLTSMAHNMTKANGSVLGYKIILQLTAFQNPSIVVANIPKVAALRNSYQNRHPIGLSILWALGLGGFKDLSVGIKVWQEVMVPVIELRNYSAYVIGYLKDILSHKSTSKPLSSDQFFAVIDVVYDPNLSLPNNIQRNELAGICTLLKKRILEVEPDKGFQNFFQRLLERLKFSTSDSLKRELLVCLVACLNKDPHCYSIWRQLYIKNLPQSALLLKHLDGLWKCGAQPCLSKQLKETIITFQVTNDELSKAKQKEDGLEDCKKYCTELERKMSVSKAFPWKLGCVLLVLAIATLLAYDIRKHGTFKDSSSGRLLRDIGALQYTEHAWARMKFYTDKSYRTLKANSPYYSEMAVNYTLPYLQMAYDSALVATDQMKIWYGSFQLYVKERIPVAIDWLDHYAPGFSDNFKLYCFDAWEAGKHMSHAASQSAMKYATDASDWMKSNVFVGNLSPDNLQLYLDNALKATAEYAKCTYEWVSQKVQTLSKIH